jgi:hypothetical protein
VVGEMVMPDDLRMRQVGQGRGRSQGYLQSHMPICTTSSLLLIASFIV